MARGDHPNSRKALEQNRAKTQFNGERAVEMGKKSGEVRRIDGMLSADLKEQLDEDTIKELNKKIIGMAKKGNLKAYEIIRDGIGERPNDKIDLSIEDESARAIDDYFAEKYNTPTGK